MTVSSNLTSSALDHLRPYVSILVLQINSSQPGIVFEDFFGEILRNATASNSNQVDILEFGTVVLADEDDFSLAMEAARQPDRVARAIVRVRKPPSWQRGPGTFLDVGHELWIGTLVGNLMAIDVPNPDQALSATGNDHSISPLSPNVVRGMFTGASRTAWTSGVHSPRTTKADSKALTGIRIQDAMSGIDESTFVLTAARMALHSNGVGTLDGTITISPSKSKFAWKRAPTIGHYMDAVVAILDRARETVQEEVAGTLVDPFPQLATLERDLGQLDNAYEVASLDPDLVRMNPFFGPDDVVLAEDLADLRFDVPIPTSGCSFELDVSNSSGTSSFKATVTGLGLEKRVSFSAASRSGHSDAEQQRIRNLLGRGELLRVDFATGHSYAMGYVARENVDSPPFHGWRFEDFTGFDVTAEKPVASTSSTDIHDRIDHTKDSSLFSWVQREWSQGFLICDDGAGELADFLHIDHTGTITAIHVKGAASASASRKLATVPYELVSAQALKTLRQIEPESIRAQLGRTTRLASRGIWNDGQRSSDLNPFLNALATRGPDAETHIAIVQPHIQKQVLDFARADIASGVTSARAMAAKKLDTLLLTTRHAVTGVCKDLTVYTSK